MIKNLFFSFIFLLFSLNNLFAKELNIAIINPNKIITKSTAIIKYKAKIQKRMQSSKNKISKQMQDLQNQQKELLENKNLFSDDAYKHKQEEVFFKIKEMEKKIEELTTALKGEFYKVTRILEGRVAKIVKQIAEKKSYNLILNQSQILFVNEVDDISNEVIRVLNKIYPKIILQ